jgi:hypothetical protein
MVCFAVGVSAAEPASKDGHGEDPLAEKKNEPPRQTCLGGSFDFHDLVSVAGR